MGTTSLFFPDEISSRVDRITGKKKSLAKRRGSKRVGGTIGILMGLFLLWAYFWG
jgi:tetrahydromethanopterin S-methyltransferase subunit G